MGDETRGKNDPADRDEDSKSDRGESTSSTKRDWRAAFTSLAAAKPSERKKLAEPVEFRLVREQDSSSGYVEVLALAGGMRVGDAHLEPREAGELYLERVLVLWPYRGQTVGARLLRVVEDFAIQSGFTHVTGEVFLNDYTETPNEIELRVEWFRSHGYAVSLVGPNRWSLKKTTQSPSASRKDPPA